VPRDDRRSARARMEGWLGGGPYQSSRSNAPIRRCDTLLGNQAQLLALIARYQSMLDYMDRLGRARDLVAISLLFTSRARYVADVASTRLIGAWQGLAEPEWHHSTEVFDISGTAVDSRFGALRLGELEGGARVVLAEGRPLRFRGAADD